MFSTTYEFMQAVHKFQAMLGILTIDSIMSNAVLSMSFDRCHILEQLFRIRYQTGALFTHT